MTDTPSLELAGRGPLIMVDDDPIDTAVIVRSHRRSKIENPLLTFEDGPSFLAMLGEYPADLEPPALVLLDINMPRLSGFEVLAKMRAIERFAAVPTVLFLSHSDHPADQLLAAELGSCLQPKFGSLDRCTEFLDSLVT